MMSLGDWTPPEPLQGVHMTEITTGLWDVRAVGIVRHAGDATDGGIVSDSGASLHVDPMPSGVTATAYWSRDYRLQINCTVSQAREFAARYAGVVARPRPGTMIIKAVAPKMRVAYA